MKSPYPILLDAVAQRYMVLPSTLMNMDVDELNWNLKVYEIAVTKENTRMKKQQIEAKQSKSYKTKQTRNNFVKFIK